MNLLDSKVRVLRTLKHGDNSTHTKVMFKGSESCFAIWRSSGMQVSAVDRVEHVMRGQNFKDLTAVAKIQKFLPPAVEPETIPVDIEAFIKNPTN